MHASLYIIFLQYRTPLHYAVETNRFDAVDFLVTKGNAKVNDMDEVRCKLAIPVLAIYITNRTVGLHCMMP